MGIVTVETIMVLEEKRAIHDLGIQGLRQLGRVKLYAAGVSGLCDAAVVRARELPIASRTCSKHALLPQGGRTSSRW